MTFWQKVSELFTSRKALASLGAILTSVGAALQGVMTWREAMIGIIGIIVVWVNSQAKVDAARAANSTPAGT